MNFEKYLSKHKNQLFKGKYIKYSKLKKLINTNLTQVQEDDFLNAFHSNFLDVFSFIEKEFLDHKNQIEASMNTKDSILFLCSLSEFTKINLVGFKKILKIHDKKI